MPKDLAALLLEDGAVSAEAVARAQARQREAGGALDTALLEVGGLSEDALVAHLARAAELPPAPPGAWSASDGRARRVFPSRVAERHGLAPFALEGRELSLVATHPVDMGLLDEISFMLSLDLKAHVAPEWRVRELIHRLYGTALTPRLAALAAAAGAEAAPRTQEPALGEAAPAPPPAEPAAPAAPAPTGFAHDDSEPREPLAAALQAALESIDPSLFEDEPGGAEEPEREGPPPDRSAPPRWSLDEARAALATAQRRDEVVLVALRYARDFFEYAAMFAVAGDAVAGHDALGAEDERDRARSVAIYAADPGIFRTVIETRSPYLGPVSRDAQGNAAILDGLGRGSPRTVLVHPVLLRDRPVCILYADNGEAPVSARRLGDLLLLLSTAGPAFERIIRDRKKRRRRAGAPSAREPQPGSSAAAASVPAAPERAAAEASPAPPAPASAATRSPAPEPEPAAPEPEPEPMRAEAEPGPEPHPPDAEPAPEDVAGTLAAAPTPGALEDPPRVDDVRIEEDAVERASPFPVDGEPVAAAVAPAQVVADSLSALEEQFFFGPAGSAAEAAPPPEEPPPPPPAPAPAPISAAAPAPAASPAEPPSFSALADRALGADAAAASEACAALAERRRDPAVRQAVEKLRRALLSGLSGRPARAARAIGAVRDVEAIPLLIQVLEVSEPETAAAAADALAAITLQRLGPDARSWLGWWKQNRGRGRAEWLFSGLTSADRETRVAASTELAHAAPPPVAYSADAPPPERERIARAWAGWWARSGHVL